MRSLVLATILGMAVPAIGAEEGVPVVPVTEAEAPDAAATSAEPARGEAALAAEPGVTEPEHALPPLTADAVARGTFATAIDHREPVDSINSLESDRDRVYYFTEFVGINGREVTHRWEYRGEVVAEVPIEVGGPRWRAYSSKELDARQLGEWTVSVIDESANVLRKDSFVYEAPAPEAETAAPATTPAATPGIAPAAPAGGEGPDEVPASPAQP